MLKLTLLVRANGIKGHVDYDKLTEETVYIARKQIVAVTDKDGETHVYTTGGQCFYVKEYAATFVDSLGI